MIKNDTIIPITYSSVICPPLQAIAATDIQACDYKKNHCDDNKYNVKHLIAPKIQLSAKILPQGQCQPFCRQSIKFQTS
jgi:hypothetical protein